MSASRREFVRASAALAAAFGLRAAGAAAPAEETPSVIWLQAQGCTGCSISLLNSLTAGTVGVCPTSHGMVAVLALEAAYGPSAAPPANGRMLRNLILGADFLQSHILHFYQLALLDYVDTREVFHRASWQPGLSGPDSVTGADAVRLFEHYVAAWDIRRKTHQLGAIFGGRMPCSPVFVPGGCTPALTNTTAGGESPATGGAAGHDGDAGEELSEPLGVRPVACAGPGRAVRSRSGRGDVLGAVLEGRPVEQWPVGGLPQWRGAVLVAGQSGPGGRSWPAEASAAAGGHVPGASAGTRAAAEFSDGAGVRAVRQQQPDD